MEISDIIRDLKGHKRLDTDIAINGKICDLKAYWITGDIIRIDVNLKGEKLI